MTAPDSNYFKTTDRQEAILLIAKKVKIEKKVRLERRVVLYFDLELSRRWLEMWQSGEEILVDIRDFYMAEVTFNAAVKSELI